MSECSNCRGTGVRAFCPDCGQEQTQHDLTVRQWVADVFDELFMINGKLPRSLVALLRPGRLTTEWVVGHRVRFVRPFRLYLFGAVIFLLADGLITGRDGGAPDAYLRAVLFLGIPLLALVTRYTLGFGRPSPSLVPDLVFSLHYHTFVFALMTFFLLLELILAQPGLASRDRVVWALRSSLMVAYFMVAAGKVYGLGGTRTLLVGGLAFALYVVCAGFGAMLITTTFMPYFVG